MHPLAHSALIGGAGENAERQTWPVTARHLAGINGNGFRTKGKADDGPAARRFSSRIDGSLALATGTTQRGDRAPPICHSATSFAVMNPLAHSALIGGAAGDRSRVMTRPKALDLFCGAGGASMGLHRAGYDVIGIDVKKQPRYPFRFVQGDALQPPFDLKQFAFIWASPPCQRYTRAQNAAKNADAHPDYVPVIREMLRASGVPYAIENVVGAPLENPAVLCGLAFGLSVKRHRLIETSFFMMTPPCPSHDQDYFVIFGHEVRNRRKGSAAGRKNKIAEGRKAMGIDWMTRGELSESIPPAYGEFVGRASMSLAADQR